MLRKLALFAVSMSSLAGCAPEDKGLESEEAEQATHRLDVQPGDPISKDGMIVIAPEANLGVYAEVVTASGVTHSLHIKTDPDRVVYMIDDFSLSDAEAAGETSASGAPNPCSDSGKNLLPYKVSGPLEWYFNAGSTPSQNSVANVEAKLQAAANNITKSRNSCGMADQVAATNVYKGRTTQGTQVNADATCKATGNGINTVGFGDLPEDVLGLACVYYDGNGHVTEADIRINKVDSHWYAVKPSSCSNRFSVEAVATHEFGHVFGLGHVSEGAHGNLTMSPQINGPCQATEATLGRGDVLGLRAKY